MKTWVMRWIVPAVIATTQIGAMLRCYRRFVFDEPEGRVWGLADDVYISACFGRALVEGHGFVWYPGAPRVEGISNPLWSIAIGALHRLPGFSADRLGAFVLGANALLLGAAAFWFAAALHRALPGPANRSVLLGLALVPGTVAVAYWSAEGFEIPLLAALCFAMLYVAIRSEPRRAAVWLAAASVAGFATRMDFALLAAPALLVYAARRPGLRNLGLLAGLGLLGALLLSLARYGYYGDWLPNTYYLKTTNWPLAARLGRGVEQNRTLLWIAPLPWLALLPPRLRRTLLARAPHALAAWFGFALTVLYSTWVGGDAWRPFGGYDRHTAIGGMLLAWGAWAAVGAVGPRWLPSAIACAIAVPLGLVPIWREDRGARIVEGVFSASVPARLERDWIRYGKAFREIAPAGARIAVCPAGAIIYFSERGGVDLLGKVDPFVARLPVASRKPPHNACWRNAPGHNKEDDGAMFELRKPEYSRYRPPPSAASSYTKQKYEGHHFYRRIVP